MKFIVFFSALVSVAVIQVTGASIYGEKEDAKIDVMNKFQETVKSVKAAMNVIDTLNKMDYPKLEENAKEERKDSVTNYLKEFEKEAIKTTRSAIARGKPAAAIECIAKTSLEGVKTFSDAWTDYLKAIESTTKNFQNLVKLFELEVKLIERAAIELKSESLGLIDNEKDLSKIPAIKNDAAKKAKAAVDQLKTIRNRVQDLKIVVEYSKVQEQFDKKLTEIEDSLKKKLQKCIA